MYAKRVIATLNAPIQYTTPSIYPTKALHTQHNTVICEPWRCCALPMLWYIHKALLQLRRIYFHKYINPFVLALCDAFARPRNFCIEIYITYMHTKGKFYSQNALQCILKCCRIIKILKFTWKLLFRHRLFRSCLLNVNSGCGYIQSGDGNCSSACSSVLPVSSLLLWQNCIMYFGEGRWWRRTVTSACAEDIRVVVKCTLVY